MIREVGSQCGMRVCCCCCRSLWRRNAGDDEVAPAHGKKSHLRFASAPKWTRTTGAQVEIFVATIRASTPMAMVKLR